MNVGDSPQVHYRGSVHRGSGGADGTGARWR